VTKVEGSTCLYSLATQCVCPTSVCMIYFSHNKVSSKNQSQRQNLPSVSLLFFSLQVYVHLFCFI